MQRGSLHSCAATAEPVRSRRHRSCEVDLCWIARRLGLLDNERRTIIEKVRRLADRHGFPLPKRPRFVRGVRIIGPKSIDAFAIWDRDVVELWFEDDRPPAENAALVATRRATARVEMGKRALMLVGANTNA